MTTAYTSMLHAGAPTNNATFFCTGNTSKCYYSMPKNTWDVQRKFCQDYGGDLVVYDNVWEQVRGWP